MPIASNITAALATAIDAMSIAGGYNFNYGPADVRSPASWVYPQTFLEFPDTSPDTENEMVDKQTHSWPLAFRVIIGRGAGDLEIEISKVNDDFIRLLSAQLTTLQDLGLLRYELAGIFRRYRNVYAAPAELRIVFNLFYRQSRLNPSSL